jgi:hypothetical protein
MKTRNVTIAIDEDLYRRARVWAAERDTTLSTVVSVLLATVPTMARAAQRFPLPGQAPASPTPAPARTPPAPQPPSAAASAPPPPTPSPRAKSKKTL